MQRLFRGSVVLAVAVGFLSCSGDPTGDFRQPSGIIASPTSVFINVGDTKPVVVSLIDEQGNQIAADFTLSDVGSGVTVVQDTTFLHTNAGVPIRNQVQYRVTGTGIANSSFTVSAAGESLVVPVRVTPSTVDIVISNPTPAWGDTITLTAPAGGLFTDASEVNFASGPPGDIVSLSPDRTVLTVVPGPNVAGAVTITNTTVAFDETLSFDITSTGTVTTPVLTDVAGTFSTQTPALGAPVTYTLPAGVRVIPATVTAAGGLAVSGAIAPRDVTVSADSSVITFTPAPNSDSVLVIDGVAPQLLPQFPQLLESTEKITTPVVDSVPSTLSTATPTVNVPVVLTSTDAAFTFVDPAVIAVGGDSSSIITAQTATSISFLPAPGSAGQVGVGGVDVAGFSLPLPSTAGGITTGAAPSLAGTDDPATAPAIPVPAVGAMTAIYDSGTYGYDAPIFGGAFGTFPSRLYRIVVPTGRTINLTINWTTTQDLGGYWFATDGTTEPAEGVPADAGGAGAHPETSSSTLLAGTYLLAIVNFGAGDPAWFSIVMEGE